MSPARWIAFSLLACLAFAGNAVACSFSIEVPAFEPDVARANDTADLIHDPAPPAVLVDVVSIERSQWGACDMVATITLALRWAAPTSLKLDNVGFYVRPVGEHTPLRPIVPSALKARVENGRVLFDVQARDWPSGGLFDFDAEIFAIDSSLRIGPSTRFHVYSDNRSTTQYEVALENLRSQVEEWKQHAARAPRKLTFYGFGLTEALRARLKGEGIDPEPCGVYVPYCGEKVVRLLARGALPARDYEGKPSEEMLVCLGVRQAPGRIARIAMVNRNMFFPIAAAEWVDATDAADWEHAALGCKPLLDAAVRQETAFAPAP